MSEYEPVMVAKLANILELVCLSLNDLNQPTTAKMRETIAKRLIAAHEAGIEDAEVLRADALSAVRTVPVLVTTR